MFYNLQHYYLEQTFHAVTRPAHSSPVLKALYRFVRLKDKTV